MFSQTMRCSLTYINVKKVNSLIEKKRINKKKQKNTHTQWVQAISSAMISAMFFYSTTHHMYLFSMRTAGIAFVAPTISTLSLSLTLRLSVLLSHIFFFSFYHLKYLRRLVRSLSDIIGNVLWLLSFFYLAWGFDSRHCWLFTVYAVWHQFSETISKI